MGDGEVPFGEIDGNVQVKFALELFDLIDGLAQRVLVHNVEAITYPLVKLVNKITGNEFADNPTKAQRVDTSQIFITTDEELETVKSKFICYTGEFEDAFLDGESVKALLAENGGTHAQLVEAVQSMTIRDLEAL